MSDDKSKVTDKASEIAKNIWLAGVGAYGRAVDEAQDRLEKAGVETPKLFRDLVQAGEALEEQASQSSERISGARSSVEERIHKVRENFNMQRTARVEDLADLHAKVDLLSKKIDILANALTEQGILKAPRKRRAPAKRAPAKKAPARKATTTKTAGKAKAKTKAKSASTRKTAKGKTRS